MFVDPPFGENIYYADLAYLIESWHGNHTASEEEAIQSRHKVSPKDLDRYAELMRQCFVEFYRVLKPGRWMTVEFSNHSNDVWLRIQDALATAGFVVADTRVFDKDQLSYRQVTADNAVKHDLVISAYKPHQTTERSFEISAGGEEAAWVFVREHLSRVPVTDGYRGQALVIRERQADRVYERMVAYHVARNTVVPMTAAEFLCRLGAAVFRYATTCTFLLSRGRTTSGSGSLSRNWPRKHYSFVTNCRQCSGSDSCSKTGRAHSLTSNPHLCVNSSQA